MGVEINGLNLTSGILEDEVKLLKNLMAKHLVVVVRNQNLSPQQQSQITRAFGDIESSWNNNNRKGDPCVYIVSNAYLQKNPKYQSQTYCWHWDKNFIHYPTSISFAFFPSEPQPEGMGTTAFSNMYLAYEELPYNLKERIENLYVIHSYDRMSVTRQKNFANASLEYRKDDEQFPNVMHPLVRVHPITEKKVLNVDELYQLRIFQFDEKEDAELRKNLLDHATQAKYLYFHVWKKGDFVLWDNLALIHRGMPSDPSILRILQRTNISSREAIEGRCFLIGIDDPIFDFSILSKELFLDPLILNSDSYADLSVLEHHIKELRKGHTVLINDTILNPSAIIILKGKSWRKSGVICSLLTDAAVLAETEIEKAKTHFPKKVYLLPLLDKSRKNISILGKKLQNLCVEKFISQDAHERMTNGELIFDYLAKKESIFAQSSETFKANNLPTHCSIERQKLQTKILEDIFKHYDFNEYIPQAIEKKDLKKTNSKAWLVYLQGEADPNKNDILKILAPKGLKHSNAVIIDIDPFLKHLFQNIPSEQKNVLLPVYHQEIRELILRATEFAFQNKINVIIRERTQLANSLFTPLTQLSQKYGVESVLIAYHNPIETILGYTNNQIYNQLLIKKMVATLWKENTKKFDALFLLNGENEQIICVTEKEKTSICSPSNWSSFISFSLINPDKLANKIASSHKENTLYIIQEYFKSLDVEFEQFLPQNIKFNSNCEPHNSSHWIAKRLEHFWNTNSTCK